MLASRPLLVPLVAVVAMAASAVAQAQSHQSTSGHCTLRSSTVDSRSIAAATAARRGFSRSADVAVIDVTVSCRGRPGNGTVAADVVVTRTDLAGTQEPVAMQRDRQNGYVSYFGTYPSVAGGTVRLEILATPSGERRALALHYSHRFVDR